MRSSVILIIALVSAIVCETEVENEARMRKRNGADRKQKPTPPKFTCKIPSIINGRYRQLPRKVTYTCDKKFMMVGSSTSICVDGSLQPPPPICAGLGCPPITYLNPMLEKEEVEPYQGAVIDFRCGPGYTLEGPVRIHCNGARWNRGQPRCVENIVSTQTSTSSSQKPSMSGIIVSITFSQPIDKSPLVTPAATAAVEQEVDSEVRPTTEIPREPQSSVAPGEGDMLRTSTAEQGVKSKEDELTTSEVDTNIDKGSEMLTEIPRVEDYSDPPSDGIQKERTTGSDLKEQEESRLETVDTTQENLELTSELTIIQTDDLNTEEFSTKSYEGKELPALEIRTEESKTESPHEKDSGRRTMSAPNDLKTVATGDLELTEPLNLITITAGQVISEDRTGNDKYEDSKSTAKSKIQSLSAKVPTTMKPVPEEHNSLVGKRPERHVTVALIVLSVVAACVLIAIVSYILVVKAIEYRNNRQPTDQHTAVPYREEELNGGSNPVKLISANPIGLDAGNHLCSNTEV